MIIMDSFKVSKKTAHTDNRMTVMAKHELTIKKIEDEKKNLDKYISELDFLKNIKDANIKNKEFENLSKINDKITKLDEKINNIIDDRELTEYLFKSMEFIIDIDMDNVEHSAPEEVSKKGEIFKFISVDSERKNEDFYKKYMSTCFPSECKETLVEKKTDFLCIYCGEKTIQDTSAGITICYSCGMTETYNVSQIPEWNAAESHDFIKPYSYKRNNHFKEWVTQIQGREGTNIPDDVMNSLIIEIKKERLTDKTLITYYKIKEFLKKLKLNKYYEHIPNIIHKITGNKQLIITAELQEKLYDMFNSIQEPFEKYCPKNRKNFLSYSYTLYKFFQLLDKNEYLIYFPLLKSREKLFEQENIWKGICKELEWKFLKCI